jgi:[ribosomal protein S18]-alanine N-acetyltransferase
MQEAAVTPGVEILPATWHDLNDIRTIEHECFGQEAWSFLDVVGVLTFPGTSRLKAMVEGRIVGFVAGDIRRNEATGWISTIGVLPAYQRLGVGSMLLAAVEADMKMPRVCLCVRKSNQTAMSLYIRHGYHSVDLWMHYYENGEDAVVMEKLVRRGNRPVEQILEEGKE